MIVLSKVEIEELKKELIDAYKLAGFKNCLGSVEKIVNELFYYRERQFSEKVLNSKPFKHNQEKTK